MPFDDELQIERPAACEPQLAFRQSFYIHNIIRGFVTARRTVIKHLAKMFNSLPCLAYGMVVITVRAALDGSFILNCL